jgi:hypothetical protein
MPEEHIPDLSPCESVDILDRIDTVDDGIGIDMRWERRLHDDTMDTRISTESRHLLLELYLTDSRRISIESKSHPHFMGSTLLHTDIGERCWIVSDEYYCESGSCSCYEDLISDTSQDSGCDDMSVEDHRQAEIVDRDSGE